MRNILLLFAALIPVDAILITTQLGDMPDCQSFTPCIE